mmetsp:Transcript_9982/g.35448  ORF Transcript_9982/g.35448 Transcript_9982/m.35448 type:complete len:269 (+) Transcript_9982:1036-1842(+)
MGNSQWPLVQFAEQQVSVTFCHLDFFLPPSAQHFFILQEIHAGRPHELDLQEVQQWGRVIGQSHEVGELIEELQSFLEAPQFGIHFEHQLFPRVSSVLAGACLRAARTSAQIHLFESKRRSSPGAHLFVPCFQLGLDVRCGHEGQEAGFFLRLAEFTAAYVAPLESVQRFSEGRAVVSQALPFDPPREDGERLVLSVDDPSQRGSTRFEHAQGVHHCVLESWQKSFRRHQLEQRRTRPFTSTYAEEHLASMHTTSTSSSSLHLSRLPV